MLQEIAFNLSFSLCQVRPFKDVFKMLSPPKQICPISDKEGRWESDITGQASNSKSDLDTAWKVTLGGAGGRDDRQDHKLDMNYCQGPSFVLSCEFVGAITLLKATK